MKHIIPMSDEKFIAMIRKLVETPPPADADANTIREHDERVAWLAQVDANGGRVPRKFQKHSGPNRLGSDRTRR